MNDGTGPDVCAALESACARFGDRAAVRHRGCDVSFRALWLAVEAVAAELRPRWERVAASGRVPRAGLLCPNGAAHVVLGLAVLRAGGCLVPVPLELAGPEREALVRRTGLDGVIAADGAGWDGWDGPRAAVAAGGLAFEWLGRDGGAAAGAFDALRPAFVRFSSGTTGESKGVVLSHGSLLERVASANRRLRLGPGDRVLWLLPMAHHFAVTIVLYLLNGVTTLIEDSHLAADVLTAAREGGATVIYGSPFHHALLAAEGSGRDWPSLRLAVSTAARLEERVASAFLARYGVPLTQGLGIIEVGLPLLNTEAAREKPGAVGRPDDVAVSVRREDGSACRAGEAGELWLRGPGMFDAYLDPWRTRAEATRDGWFATGDVAEQDADGVVWLRGRVKSVINVGGMKCFPEEIESVLNAHPAVAVSRVTGEPSARWGMVPVAEVELRPGVTPPPGAVLAAHCRSELAAYKVPLRFRQVDRVPRTASGKVSRAG